jgi:radical SAM superfamily enzyme YgiQ (UPF0313 family)
MKVALVQAPVFDPNTPSNALALLTAHLKKIGVESVVHDASRRIASEFETLLKTDFRDGRKFYPLPDRYPEEMDRFMDAQADRIAADSPDVVGFSVLARTEAHSLSLAGKIKKRRPSTIVVFGGAQCLRENMAFDFIRHPDVDAVALAEADLSFPRFLQALVPGGPLPVVPGILTKVGSNIFDPGDGPEVTELDSLPYLDFSGFDLDEYDSGTMYLSTTRGCVRKCSFCTHIVGQKVYRTMSAERTVAEIEHQMRLYPKRNRIEFTDSLVNGNVRRLADMSRKLVDFRVDRVAANRESSWDFGWAGMAIIHPTMNRDLLVRLRHAGCVQLRYGLESASQKVLDSMQKNMRIADAETVIRNTRDAGIAVFLYVLVGFPTETEADFLQTMDFIERNSSAIDQVGVSSCEIQKASHLDVHPELYGIRTPLEDRLRWVTKDGSNTYAVRQERLRRLNELIDRLKLRGFQFPTRLGATLKEEPEYEFYGLTPQ